MKTKFSGILTLLLALVVQLSFAQEKTISGTVTDDSGLPLPGTTVVVKGTSKGASTNFDGNYAITAKTGDILVFSFIGYTTQEMTVAGSNTINTTMVEDTESLDEVVIVGYGTATKQSFTGTASVVDSEVLELKSLPNVTQALAGESAGVTVINTSGQPGNASTIRIRGFGSVNGNRDPLYVIDGAPFTVPRVPNSDVGDDDLEQDFANTISPLNSINPQDIKSITILKDAAATAIYGSRGANGVILIETKKGKSGESSIEVEVKTGINTQIIPRYDVVTSPEEAIGYVWEGIYNRGVGAGEDDPVAYANANLFTGNYIHPEYNMWNADADGLIDPSTRSVRPGVTRRYDPESFRDLSFASSFRTEANLRITGGNDKTQYFASAGALDDKGYAINTGYKRYMTRLNLNSQVKKWLKIGSSLSYTYSENQNNGQTVGSENLFEFADKNPPFFPVFLRDANGNLVEEPIFGGYQYDYGSASPGGRPRTSANLLNPIGSAMYDFLGSERHDVVGNFYAEIGITEDLTFETRFGLQYSQDRQKNYSNPFYGSEISQGGTLLQRDQIDITKNFLQLLRYNKSFGDHNVTALVAHESNDYKRQRSTASKRELAVPGLLELNNFVVPTGAPTGWREGASIESWFSQVNYNYKDTYYISGSLRRDGSSRFADGQKWGTFGSIGGSWIMSNEGFLSSSNIISFMKLKTSYGIIGDQAGIDFYQQADSFNINNLNDSVSLSERLNGNPELTWETSKMFQVGLETSFGRFLDLDLDYYIKDTDNLFFDRNVGPSQGISSVTVNDGVLQNRGLEFSLTYHVLNTKDGSLDFTLNGANVTNEFKTMPIEPSTGLPKIIDTSPLYYAYSKGSSIFDFFLREWAGVDPQTGVGMWYQYFDDANNNGVLDTGEEFSNNVFQYKNDNPDANLQKQTTTTYSDAQETYVGKSSIPDVSGAFRIAGTYKNWSLSTQFTYSIGGTAFDAQYSELMNDRFGAGANNFHRDIAGRWQQPGDVTDIPRISDNFDTNVGSSSTRWLVSSDYLALNNFQLGYGFPSEFLANTGIDKIDLWISGDNLFVTTKRKGFNPQTSETGNTGRRLYAPLSTLTFGARFKF